MTFYLLVVMCLKTRRVAIAGVTANPDGPWVRQIGRNVTNSECGFLRGVSYVILDRDKKFLPFRGYLEDNAETAVVVLPPKSPNLNAYLERFMRSLKSECLDRMIFFGRASLERALKEFVEHYHSERNHQGRERLGGMLHYFYRKAA